MFFKCNCNEEIKELKERIRDIEQSQADFLMSASKTLTTVLDNDKRKFAYELQQQDMVLIEEGKKVQKIRKIIS